MHSNIKICEKGQLDLLREISIETYRDTFSSSNSDELMKLYLSDALNRQKLLTELNHQHSYFYFIYFEGEVAGFLKMNELEAQTDVFDPDSLEVERFYIRKQFLHKGLGKQLIGFACSIAEKLGKKYLWLGVWEDNQPALSFYKRFGFYQFGKHPFNMGGDIQTDLLFKKDL